jgi:ATP-binding cassette subfamily B protein/subfamily B ATP-binding cassette protein MsbA
MTRYGRLLRHPLQQWPLLLLILGLSALSSAATALRPWPVKLLVDYALGDSFIPERIQAILSALALPPTPVVLIFLAAIASLALLAFDSAVEAGTGWAWTVSGQRMVYDLAATLFHHLQRLSPSYHLRHPIGDSLSRMLDDTYCVYTVADRLLVAPSQHLLTLITVGAVAYTLDPLLTVLSFLVAPLMGGATAFFAPRLKRQSGQSRQAQSRLLSFVHQTLTAIPVVQAFGTEERNRQHFRNIAQDAVTVSQKGILIEGGLEFSNGFVTIVGTALVLYVGGLRVLSGVLTVGSLLVFLAYLRSMQNAFRSLLEIYAKLKATEAVADRVLEVLDAEERVEEAADAQPLPLLPSAKRGHVRLEGVTFGYEANRPMLRDVSLEARPGEMVALVGRTGAGKSTLVSLIPRFFDPWQGSVLFDGIDVRHLQLHSLRAQVALVLQEPFLLPLSIAENIAYGRPNASHEEIVAAAVAARADEFIQQLPQGYGTLLGERGATLSGGQRQRLAIARALLKDAPVLILDEPTSALDSETENKLLEALERLMEGRTTFIIAHRLSTIRRADRIVVLDQGRVVESGTHQELVNASGAYWKFFSAQDGPALQNEFAMAMR